METLIDMIHNSSIKYNNKVAFTDTDNSYTFNQVESLACNIATAILNSDIKSQAIALYMQRSAKIPVAMAGVLMSGCFYNVLDVESPMDRLNKIIDTLNAKIIICDDELENNCKETFKECQIFKFSEVCNYFPNLPLIENTVDKIKPNDLAFTIFTSGSTGTPKGTMITHKNVLSYATWFTTTFAIDENINFGSQTPYYFSMSVSDLYGAWLTGASYHIIPKSYFTFPAKLIDYINEKKIDTIYWVPTALGIVAKFDLLNYAKPLYLKNIFFAGEVMPIKYLNYWRDYLPSAKYVNLFGPTETTDICTYYIVDKNFKENQTLPIGIACQGLTLYILDENGKNINQPNKSGELYVEGPFVAKGYYNNPTKTEESFVNIPHTDSIVYKTGDLVSYNDDKQLIYLGRKDYQIKHLGYRIELGEIEAVMNGVDEIELCVCLYDEIKDEIILFYEGNKEGQALIIEESRKRLPSYMVPSKVIYVENFPLNANGKIDKLTLRKSYM